MARSDESGFTLTETLVALFIMISAATLLYRGFAGGMAAAGAADAQQAALTLARTRLALLGAETPLEAGRYRGREGAMSWTVSVTPYGSEEEAARTRLGAFWAEARVTWRDRAGGHHHVALTTLKLRERHENAAPSQ